MAAWLHGCETDGLAVAAWLCGCVEVAVRLRGCGSVRPRGCVAVAVRGCVAAWLTVGMGVDVGVAARVADCV